MIRFGITGTGRISDWVLKGASQDSRIRITAVCSRTKEAAEAFIRRNPIAENARIYTSVKEMAADPQVDAVYIGTPNQTHCDYTVTCLKAGKHVLCEKPLAINASEGHRMAEAAKESGCLLMEAMISTLNPNFREVAARIEEIVEKTKELKKYLEENNLETYIEVDGGVNKETINMVKEAGIDIAVAGSAIINAEDFKQAINKLKFM